MSKRKKLDQHDLDAEREGDAIDRASRGRVRGPVGKRIARQRRDYAIGEAVIEGRVVRRVAS